MKDVSHQRRTAYLYHQNKHSFDILKHTRHTSNHMIIDDVTVYLNLIGVQDSLHAESAQPRNSPDTFPHSGCGWGRDYIMPA